jgi:hypothetical protein
MIPIGTAFRMQRTMLFGMLAGRNKGLAEKLKARAAKVGSKDE